MKKHNILLMLFAAVLISATVLSGCKKECDCDDDDDNNNGDDWAALLAGTYSGTATEDGIYTNNATTIITRVSNKVVNIQMNYPSESFCLDSVNVNSASTFGISEYDGCASENASGGGNLSGSNLAYTWTEVGGSSMSVTFNGSK